MKFVPVTVIVRAALPAFAEAGEIEMMEGTGFGVVWAAMFNVTVFEVRLPAEAGFTAATLIAAAVARSALDKGVCSDVDDTYSVGLAAPFQVISVPWTKFEPVAVSVVAAAPAVTPAGEIEVMAGVSACVVVVLPVPEDAVLPQPASARGRKEGTDKRTQRSSALRGVIATFLQR